MEQKIIDFCGGKCKISVVIVVAYGMSASGHLSQKENSASKRTMGNVASNCK